MHKHSMCKYMFKYNRNVLTANTGIFQNLYELLSLPTNFYYILATQSSIYNTFTVGGYESFPIRGQNYNDAVG